MTYISGGTLQGVLRLGQPTTAPAVSATNEGRIYYDQTSQTFKMSLNGAAYVDVAAGGAESLAATLAVGNTTGGSDIVVTDGDDIVMGTGAGAANLLWNAAASGNIGSSDQTQSPDVIYAATNVVVGNTVTIGTAAVAGSAALAVDAAAGLTLGGTSATSVAVGRTGVTTTVPGALAVTQTSTFTGAATFSATADFDTGATVAAGQSITGDGALSVTATGNNLNLTTTAGSGGVGPTVNITASSGATASTGGEIVLQGGAGGATSGDGGTLRFRGGHANGSGEGGSIVLTPGDGVGANSGGDTFITAGEGGLTGAGGAINLQAGDGGATSGSGGDISITCGTATSGTGGLLTLNAGTSNGGNGGSINITGGIGSVDGGSVAIEGGYNGSGALGQVLIGQDDAATGTIVIGLSGGSQTVTINNAGTITGATAVPLRVRSGVAQSLELGVAGTSYWSVNTSGHFLAVTDDTNDIGAAGANRPRRVYVGTEVVVGNTITIGSSTITGNGNVTIDTGAAGTLNLGNTNATSIVLGSASTAVSIPNDLVITGDLTVNGTTTTVNTTNLTVTDALIYANNGGIADSPCGMAWDQGAEDDAIVLFNGVAARFEVGRADTTGGTSVPANLSVFSDLKAANLLVGGTAVTADAGLTVTATAATLNLAATDANVVQITTNGAARWNVDGNGHLLANTDNTIDIGASGATRPRTVYAGTSVVVPAVDTSATLSIGTTTATAVAIGRTGQTTTVNGSLSVSQVLDPTAAVGAGAIATVSTNTTLDGTNAVVLVDASGGPVTITLPAAAGVTRRHYVIKKIDSSANAVTIDGDGTETIDGSATQDLAAQYESMDLVCNGTAWFII